MGLHRPVTAVNICIYCVYASVSMIMIIECVLPSMHRNRGDTGRPKVVLLNKSAC
jgi:hypothetical protein